MAPVLGGPGGAWASAASSSDVGSALGSDDVGFFAGAKAVGSPAPLVHAKPAAQPSLLTLLGAQGLKALVLSLGPRAGAGPGETTALVFQQVLKVFAALQCRLQESEALVAELQARADNLEEQRRTLTRRADRAERARDEAVQRCEAAEAAARRARLEAAPIGERYMEAQVLRSQLEAANEELQRLRNEADLCREEVRQGWPRLGEAEDAEAECESAISELRSAHTEEVAVLKSQHLEEMAEIRGRHAERFAELEAMRCDEVSQVKQAQTEELSDLRKAVDGARWQAEVYVRETQDFVREVCLRQRENARIAKRHAEARHEAMELCVKIEAARAMETGAPAREAELQAVRHRYALLQQTKLEWQEALERKRADCEAWRRRAVQRGTAAPEERDELEEEAFSGTGAGRPPSPSAGSVSATGGPPGGNDTPAEAEQSPALASGTATPVGTPMQTPLPRRRAMGLSHRQSPSPSHLGVPPIPRMRRLSAGSGARAASGGPPLALGPPLLPGGEDVGLSAPIPAPSESSRRPTGRERGGRPRRGPAGLPQPAPVLALPAPDGEEREEDGVGAPPQVPEGPAAEFLSAAVRLAILQVDAEMTRGGSGGDLSVAIQEAENELEMSAFLLDDTGEVEGLLEMEAQQRPPAVARRLRELLAELTTRGQSQRRGPPRSPSQVRLLR
uniref:Uncharacterized protein n=1 Tax=Alexandrium monilatum TaxID=311494 RepID=A0A7S4VLF9_9DINO